MQTALQTPAARGKAEQPHFFPPSRLPTPTPTQPHMQVLIENIFPCGGGSAARGLARRLLAEARTVAPPPLQPGLCGVPEYMPDHTAKVAAWMGGALLAKVGGCAPRGTVGLCCAAWAVRGDEVHAGPHRQGGGEDGGRAAGQGGWWCPQGCCEAGLEPVLVVLVAK